MFTRLMAHRLASAIHALPGASVPRPHFWEARSSTSIRRARRSSNAGAVSKSEPWWTAIREASKRWRGVHHWKPVMQVFQILFGEERVPIGA